MINGQKEGTHEGRRKEGRQGERKERWNQETEGRRKEGMRQKSLLLLEEALILRNFGKNEHQESRCIIISNKHAKQKKGEK